MFKGFLFFCLLLNLHTVHSYIKFNISDEETVKIPTYSFFQYETPFFDVQGPSVEMPITANKKGANCSVIYNLTDYNSTLDNTTNQHTITFLDYAGSPCFFDTFANTYKFFNDFREYLKKLGYPQPDTLVLLRQAFKKSPDIGFPNADYQANSPKTNEDPPPSWLKLQMIDAKNATVTMKTIRQNNNSTFRVVQEPGPWNEAFLSFWYRGIIWLLVIILSIALIISLYFVYVSFLDGVLTINLKYIVYTLALIDSIFHIVTMNMRCKTWSYAVSINLHALLITWAFYLLLYLWSVIMDRLQKSTFILAFRGIIVFSLLIYTAQKVFEIVVMFNRKLIKELAWIVLSNYLFPGVQYLLSITFVITAFFFYGKTKDIRGTGTNNSTADTLKKLTGIAITGFLCYFALALKNTSFLAKFENESTAGAILFLVYYIINVVRCIAILFIITLRESTLLKRERSWLELRVSFIEEKFTSLLGSRRGSSTSDYTSAPSSTGLETSQMPSSTQRKE